MQRQASHRAWPHGFLRLAISLAAILLLIGTGYIAGVHQHRDTEASGHCAVCSLAAAHADPTAPVPLAPAPILDRVVFHAPPVEVEQAASDSPTSTRAPPVV
jgi:hypothetical protein